MIPSYSSFIGNLVYRGERLPDPILSSIEIGRRGYEYYHQYVVKDKSVKKNIILPDLELIRNKVVQSLEELNYKGAWSSLSDLYYSLKKVKCKYRFSIEDSIKYFQDSFSSKFFTKSLTEFMTFV